MVLTTSKACLRVQARVGSGFRSRVGMIRVSWDGQAGGQGSGYRAGECFMSPKVLTKIEEQGRVCGVA